jgi:hypothetical protein
MNRLRPVCALAAGLLSFLAAASGQSSSFLPASTSSASGQFVVSSTPVTNPYFRRPDPGTNAGYLRLEPSLLAVSAERFKADLRKEIGIAPDASWSGKIFLALHPARSLDEPVVIVTQPFLGHWDYRLEMPDIISRNRCARAFSAVLLLELANRQTPDGGRLGAVPDWLADGLARQIMAGEETRAILSAPVKLVNTIPETRLDVKRRGIDPLIGARRVLQNSPALTFDQLSWPTGTQENGDDGGVYLASAQLFVDELLALQNGPARMRALLSQLSSHANWQTAFYDAFRANFSRPLDVEKWWALRVIAFAARNPGSRWTPAVSRDRLDAALVVPVDIRRSSNSLPAYAEISLQSAIRHFAPPRQTEILQTRLRDLELLQLRLAPELASVAAGYSDVLADFLGERKRGLFHRPPDVPLTLKRLDALDARRREAESRLKPSVLPPDLNPSRP